MDFPSVGRLEVENRSLALQESSMQRCYRLLSDPIISKQLLLCALNVAGLVGTLFASPSFPLMHGVAIVYKIYPFIWLAPSLLECYRKCEDLYVVCRARRWSLVPLAAFSLMIQMGEPLFTLGGPAASLCFVFSKVTLGSRIITVLTVWGRSSVCVELAKDILSIFADKQIAECFKGELPVVDSTAWLYLRLRLRREKWVEWAASPSATRATTAVTYLEAVSFFSKMKGLRAILYYPGNALTKCYPNSWVQYSIYLAFNISVLWDLIQEKQMGKAAPAAS